MKAEKIIDISAKMLGFQGISDERIQSSALSAFNRIYAELFFSSNKEDFREVKNFNEDIEIDERTAHDVMPYGVASLMASALGDSENQAFFSDLYNLKRKKQKTSTVSDVLPTV